MDPVKYNSFPQSQPPTDTYSDSNTVSFGPTANSDTRSLMDEPNKKIRKPYTITKSRESWTEQEHDKFLEALQLFDRDWKKIEAFIGSKNVIQIRSHAQKYFLKVQKNGTNEHVPPPRPKRKAAHPYPQKAPTTATVVSQMGRPLQAASTLAERSYAYQQDSSTILGNSVTSGGLPSWSFGSVPQVMSQTNGDGGVYAGSGSPIMYNCCYRSSNESSPRTWQTDQGNQMRGMPDFAQVYKFIGSVFDPNASGHLERLQQMDPINMKTALLLMRNLSINLMNPEFENHRKLLASYVVDMQNRKCIRPCDNNATDNKPGNIIPAV